MLDLENKQVLVIGLGVRGQAACALLLRARSRVSAMDQSDTSDLRRAAERLRADGVEVTLNAADLPPRDFACAVVSPAVPLCSPLVESLVQRNIPVIGELELGFQQIQCLAIAIAGTNGKGTTAGLVAKLLAHNDRKAVLAGHGSCPVCSVADQTAQLDFVVLQVNAFQLERTRFFRPAVAVLLNLAPDHLERFHDADAYARAYARLFQNQQSFDWAIVQAEALAHLQRLDAAPKSKIITFSARDSRADIHLDRGLIISRLPNWEGPLLDMDQCQLQGPHNAENLMAALAVGRALRLPLERMLETAKAERHGPHCFEVVAEVNGIQFVDDSKATNLSALEHAVLTARTAPDVRPNIWVIAGGQESRADFHSLGPLLSRRVRGAFLIGEAREKIRSAWSLFTPCTLADSLLEAIIEAAKNAIAGDVVLLSPACSSFDQFQDYRERGEKFCQIVKSISRGGRPGDPNINGKN